MSTSLWLSLAALIIAGAGDMISVFVRGMLVQLETPDSIRGRVSAVNSMFIGASNELGVFRAGNAGRVDVASCRRSIWGGVCTLAVVGSYLSLFPAAAELDRFPDPDTLKCGHAAPHCRANEARRTRRQFIQWSAALSILDLLAACT